MILPTDLPSFLWGAAVAGLGFFLTGFLTKAGEKAFEHVANKLKPPEPTEMPRGFVPTAYAPGDCAWVAGVKIDEYVDAKYGFYPHPKTGGKCYRLTANGTVQVKEYLMHKPGAKQQIG